MAISYSPRVVIFRSKWSFDCIKFNSSVVDTIIEAYMMVCEFSWFGLILKKNRVGRVRVVLHGCWLMLKIVLLKKPAIK
jgi:hypothetical protein